MSEKSIKDQLLAYAKRKYKASPEHPFRGYPDYAVLRHESGKKGKWFALFMEVPESKLPVKDARTPDAAPQTEDPVGDYYASLGRNNSPEEEDRGMPFISAGDIYPGKGSRTGRDGSRVISIVDFKCDPMLAGSLRQQPGILPAYHMSKTSWITALLDGTVPVKNLKSLMDLSYELTEGNAKNGGRITNWVIPANPKLYDIVSEIRDNPGRPLRWNQTAKIHAGDTVYIYMPGPVFEIRYRCTAAEVNIPVLHQEEYAGLNHPVKYEMLLNVTAVYDKAPITRELLVQHGVTNIRGARGIPESLVKDIEAMYPETIG